MLTQAKNFLKLPLLGGGIAALLVSGIAVASLALSAQGFSGAFDPAGPAGTGAGPERAVRATYKCAECGVIESMRKIEMSDVWSGAKEPARTAAGDRKETEGRYGGNYAITIRLQDGSIRVITDAHSAKWRPGERVTLIGGME